MPYPAKPTELHKRDGTYRKDRHSSRLEVEPVKRIPPPPPDFDKKRAIKWGEVCGYLKDNGLLAACDLDNVRSYISFYFDLLEAEETLKAEGKYVRSDNGSIRLHPAWRVKVDCQKELKALSALFGFSALDRTRVNGKPEKEKETDPFLELLKLGE